VTNRGVIATLREVECTGSPIIPPSRDYFVFVHGAAEGLDRGNLVLAYREWSDGDWQVAPRITWRSNSALKIETGQPSLMPYERTSIGGIALNRVVGNGVRIPDEYEFQNGKDWHNLTPSAGWIGGAHW